ncbi:hypothetical protein APHAL10511_004674 [Amanita phalloides]|nr:hypothetical protein APHAL10511_004674 [Amanita phalloides]
MVDLFVHLSSARLTFRLTPKFFKLSAATLAFYGLYRVVRIIYAELTSPIRHLPGPANANLFFGHLKHLWSDTNHWHSQYGPMVRLNGFLGLSYLYVTDPEALSHILTNGYVYTKPSFARRQVAELWGPGLPFVEGDQHKKQRKLLHSAFGPVHIREFTECFVEKSRQLRDVWAAECSKQGGTGRLDVLTGLGEAGLDIICSTAFHHELNSLGGESELSRMTTLMSQLNLIRWQLQRFIPILRFIPDPVRTQLDDIKQTFFRMANQLLDENKASAQGMNGNASGRDILSLLVRANMSPDVPEHRRLSDDEVKAQVVSFVIAGESSPLATSWVLFSLAKNREIQAKLRQELFTVDTYEPTADQLNALTYLDMVIRETLRLYPPFKVNSRVSMEDDTLPLAKPIVDRRGNLLSSISLKKGQVVIIPLSAIHKDKSIWGEDALDFRPERWECLPESVNAIPGIWSHLLSFWGGPRSCIGFRFAITEMKALVFTLVRAFEFDLAVPADRISEEIGLGTKPTLTTDSGTHCQLPLLIKPYTNQD